MIKIKIRIIITKVQLNVYIKLSVRAGGGCRFRLIHPTMAALREIAKRTQAR